MASTGSKPVRVINILLLIAVICLIGVLPSTAVAQLIWPSITNVTPSSAPTNNFSNFTITISGIGFNDPSHGTSFPNGGVFAATALLATGPGQPNVGVPCQLVVSGNNGACTAQLPLGYFLNVSPGEYQLTMDWCNDTCLSPNMEPFTITPASCASGLQPETGATLIDPVPDLLDGAAITTDLTALNDPHKGRLVKGVAADGVAQLVIRIPACRIGENVTVSVLDDSRSPSSSPDNDGGVATPGQSSLTAYTSSAVTTASGTDEQPFAIITYRAPIDFARQGNAADTTAVGRSVFLQITLDSLPGQPIMRKVTILRPPIILVHGLWSSRYVWGAFAPITEFSNNALYADRVFAVDYSNTAAESVLTNRPIVGNQISEFITDYSSRNSVATVQADVVAHSMGGLIVRSLALDTLPVLHEFTGPYDHGLTHKLITIDTPHHGSPLAEQLAISSNRCKSNFAKYGRPITGAIQDLVPGSRLLSMLATGQSTTPIMMHTIVGLANPDQTINTELEFSLEFLRLPWPGGCTTLLPDSTFLGTFGEPNDLIVGRSSQLVGPSTIFTGLIHSVDPTLFPFGPDVLSYDTDYPTSLVPLVIPVFTPIPKRVGELLNTFVSTGQFSPTN